MNFTVLGKTYEFTDETALGEPTAWIYLTDKSSIEVTHEECGLKEPFYSIRHHCSDEEEEIYHKTCGVINVFCTDNISEAEKLLSDYLKIISKQKIYAIKKKGALRGVLFL